MLIIGVMSGTSLDGIDVARCHVEGDGLHDVVTLQSFMTSDYSASTKELVERALNEALTAQEWCDLSIALACDYADAIRRLDLDGVEAVAIHGQTLWHAPRPHSIGRHTLGSTLQAASGTALAGLLNLPVISDFRTADVMAGGQGAPLVPMFDRTMLHHATRRRVALNIGGMANITILDPSAADFIRAFDTGPGNVLIDAATRVTFGKQYDDDGSIARAGRIATRVLEELQTLPYFAEEPPKSTGRELFNDELVATWYRRYMHPSTPSEDFVTTLTELTAWSIADHIRRYASATDDVIVSGGGVHNSWLMERIAHHLPSCSIVSSADTGISPDAKEAMCFAYLGWRTLQGLPGNIPSVTGASRPVVLGQIAPAPTPQTVIR